MTRVCLVEDQAIVRQGLRALLDLADGIEVVAEARDGEEALACVHRAMPDVLLLDVRLPKLDGIGVLRALRERASMPPTIVLTTFDDEQVATEALRLGARGYLLKDVSLEQLTLAIQVVQDGGTMILPTTAARLYDDVVDVPLHAARKDPDALTPRELEVLRVMVDGCSNREIATTLHLAEGTVKNHVSAILAKLGVRDRTRAVLKAIDLGLETARS